MPGSARDDLPPGDAGPVEHGQALRFLLAFVSGIVLALVTQDYRASPTDFAATLVGGFAISFLLFFWVHHQFLLPAARPDFTERDSASLTRSITSSNRSAYAISSNWLELWRTSTFRYYLHLDTTMSLVSYSASLASPLDVLSNNPEDKEEFIDYGWELLAAIAAGRPPLGKHRVRLLIYPEWAYEAYENEVKHLISSHSAARIPCIPLVAERLHQELAEAERERVEQLVGALHQTALDKLPPVSRRYQWRSIRALKRGKPLPWWRPPFPDMLLIDSSLKRGSVWWYSSAGRAQHWDVERDHQAQDAKSVFELICGHARDAAWADYDADSIGGVAIVATPDRLESEAFFTRRYYTDWLTWIETHAERDAAGRSLARWLDDESAAMKRALSTYAAEHRNGQQDNQLEILDVGCGFGRHLVDVLGNQQDWRGIGIDINPSMVGDANRLAKNKGVHRQASFIVDDAAVLESCADGEIDFAVCMTNTLGNLPKEKQSALIRNLGRVLKPGGRVFLSAYAEGSTDARVKSYEAIGLDVERDDKSNRIMAAQGLESESFSATDLQGLLIDNGLRLVGSVKENQSIGVWAVAERPQPTEVSSGAA